MVSLVVDRDSVCMADDINPHAMQINLPTGATLADAMSAIDAARFLDSVRQFIFIVRDGEHGRPLALMRSRYLRYVADPAQCLADQSVLHFEYHLQDDLTALWEALRSPDQVPVDHIFSEDLAPSRPISDARPP